MDEENEISHVYEIEPEAIWSCRVNDDEVRIYVNLDDYLTLSNQALELLGREINRYRK